MTEADGTRAQKIAAQNHASLDDVEIVAADRVMLHAWMIQPLAGNGDAVILLHGQADNRAGMLWNADLMLQHGYSVLLPDARAHGASGGQVATYGVLEAGDVRRWYNWLAHSHALRCIDGMGDSMGGAQLLRSLAEEQGFCGVVAESAFASFHEAAYDRLGQEFGAGPWLGRTLLRPAVEAGMLYVRWKYEVNLALATPESAVGRFF